MDIINDTIVIIILSFDAILFNLIDIEIIYKVWMGDINTTINNGNDDLRLSSLPFPCGIETDVGTSYTLGELARVVVVP